MAVENPWLSESWNLTAQGAYIRKYGVEVARGKAKKAGTVLGAPAPRAASPQTIVIVQRRDIGGSGGGLAGSGTSGDGPPS